jgi:two-component system OmpR family sensor kinase
MTLRLRLVLALVVLVTIGLAVFGLVTYSLYASSEYHNVDTQLRSSVDSVGGQLLQANGLSDHGLGGGNGNSNGNGSQIPPVPPGRVAQGLYAELRGPGGTIVGQAQQFVPTSELPSLPTKLIAPAAAPRLFDTGSVKGSTRWRVIVSRANDRAGYTIVLAVPTKDVTASLQRLAVIEGSAALALLIVLAAGAWFVLRRGLLPLEHMAGSARSITAGDLSQRVTPSDSRSEVGQLGLALNTMLGDIEVAFHEREQTEARLRQFLADASHELRTPLTSIQGFAELFRLGGEGDGQPDLPIIMRRIEEESVRMKHLVEDLLLLARLDQTRPADRKPVDLAVLAADACTDAAAVAPDRQVSLDAPQPVVVLGDQDHLRQAIANLVGNALRHTPDGTPVNVSARIVDGAASVSVRDHGPGLDPDALAHAFDRFWQADGARVGHGAGLGLSIVAAIAHEHAGAATVENMADGGACFTLTLPLHATRPTTPTS